MSSKKEYSKKKSILHTLDGKINRTRLIGLEPIIFGTEIQRSIQLSYKRIMIQQRSVLKVSDNSGAKTVRCIKVLGGFKKKYAKLGDLIVVSIQQLRNKRRQHSKVKKKEIHKALVIRTKVTVSKKNGVKTCLNENSIVLINKQGNPIGTRIVGPLPGSLRKKNFQKFLSISSGVV